MKNIVVLVSGGGTNLQALIDSEARGEIKNGKITCVISSNPEAYALERAAKAGIALLLFQERNLGTVFPTARLFLQNLINRRQIL